ncbi:type II secretion system F family protein [Dechloromonas denitrificans]|uniref:type II secretion system F family protein n=1 Tax=Dechloromonas denitrificans TaxID=281362 RepID=UPI001CF819A9|nr:type II secretion system F family protein [Dechloromonas denitrificans]
MTAVFPGQGVSLLRVAADSPEAVAAAPALQGGLVVSLRVLGEQKGGGRRGKFPLPLFTRQLLALLQAGLTVVEGLDTLAAQDQGSITSEVIGRLLTDLREGQSLSAALQRQPEAFPNLYVATVKASEQTGDMPEALQRYIVFHEKLADLKKKIVSAAIYPVMLMSVGGIVTLFLLGYVVPRFSLVFADSGRDPQGVSSLLFAWGGFINQHAGELAIAALVAVLGLVALFRLPAVRAAAARAAWRFPGMGERIRLVYLARFYRTTGMLLRAGIPLKTTLGMVADILPAALREGLLRAVVEIEQGRPFSRAAEGGGLTTPVALRMIAVGERSGQLGDMMEAVATFYDEEINRFVDTFTRLFEPLLMTIIGGIVGGIVLLLYMPIFELAGNFQ